LKSSRKKNSLRLITAESYKFLYLFLSTITSRAAADNNDCNNNNNAVDIVEKVFHFLPRFSQMLLIYHKKNSCQDKKFKKNKNFFAS